MSEQQAKIERLQKTVGQLQLDRRYLLDQLGLLHLQLEAATKTVTETLAAVNDEGDESNG